MAIRSSAGTGVIVSLVVFVLSTVFLLVLSIVFYISNREQIETVENAEAELQVYATSQDRNDDHINNYAGLAKAANQSVTRYLYDQIVERNNMLTGNPSATIEQLKIQLEDYISEDSNIEMTLSKLQSNVQSIGNENGVNEDLIGKLQAEIGSLHKKIGAQAIHKDVEVQKVKVEWRGVLDGAKELTTTANNEFDRRVEALELVREEFRGQIELALDSVKLLEDEKARLLSTVSELMNKIDSNRMNTVDPSLLVDGRVLEVGTGNEVFIDRGEQDHIVLGMTFDIYESPSQLRFDENGDLPRGKATIEVVKVGPTTSTAKIKRSTSSQPIIRDNIIYNPVYDPDYKFSFIVHGQFDADGDGEPESNNGFIKNKISHWGGIVIPDEGIIPGDLDFLVLGIPPRKPMRQKKNSTSEMWDAWAVEQKAYNDYDELRKAAIEARVLILSANRLNVLTGHQSR